MLQVKSKYFLEMGINQVNKYHKKKLSRDNDLTTEIGYVVEQLTLNQWVQGSNPWRCTKEVYLTRIDLFYFSFDLRLHLSSFYDAKGHSDSA